MRHVGHFIRTGILAVTLAMVGAHTASAATLTFDDLGNFVDLGTVSPYNGFNFTFFTSATSPVAGNFGNGVVSSPNEIFSGGQFGGPTDIVGTIAAASGEFTFNSVYMTYGWLPSLQVLVTGYNGATAVNTTTLTLANSAATQFVFNWTGLTSVTFMGLPGTGVGDPFGCGTFNCTQFTVDNLVVNEAVQTAVPEPASLTLLGLGMLGSAASRRRARKRS